jgi:signal peptidase I
VKLTPLKVALLLLTTAALLWAFGFDQTRTACVTGYQTEQVLGASLAGLVESGDQVKIALNYYSCNPVSRGDLVIYRDAGNAHPLIKIAQAVSGDTFTVALSEGGAKILVNGRALMTTTGEVYRLSESSYELLSLYERDYHGVIPAQTLLILGNQPGGSRDSSQFGLVSMQDLVGKVVSVSKGVGPTEDFIRLPAPGGKSF